MDSKTVAGLVVIGIVIPPLGALMLLAAFFWWLASLQEKP